MAATCSLLIKLAHKQPCMRVLITALTLSASMEMTQAFTCKPFHTPKSEMAATKYWQAILLLAIVGILVHLASLCVCGVRCTLTQSSGVSPRLGRHCYCDIVRFKINCEARLRGIVREQELGDHA